MPKIDLDRKDKLFEIATSQAGYFTAKQAFQCGYSYRLHHYHKSQGSWIEIDRGIFRLANYPNSPNEDLVRWSLWSFNREGFPQAIISHETALSLHEMSDVMPAHIHFTIPPTFRKKAEGGCIVHKGKISDKEIEKRQGFYLTTPFRTIIDVAEGNLSMDELEKAIRDGIRKGYFTPMAFKDETIPTNARRKISKILSIIQGDSVSAGRV